MGQLIEVSPGEVCVKFTSPSEGKISFADLGITNDDLFLEGGFLRLKFDVEGIKELDYFAVPTIQLSYEENCSETHWQCDFNGETILDKMDNHGQSTVLLLSRKRLSELEHRHVNQLVVHGEFPQPVHLIAEESFINFFK